MITTPHGQWPPAHLMSDPAPPAGGSFLHQFSSSKGSTTYAPNQSFLLHVIWQAPSAAAAQELLSGLSTCAAATHRDTPCVPTYFFRVAPSYHDVCSPAPLLLKDHPHITQVNAFETAFDIGIHFLLRQCPSIRRLMKRQSKAMNSLSHRRLPHHRHTASSSWAYPPPPATRSCGAVACPPTSWTAI